MSWSEPGFGFFGRGFWGRRVLWDNVPVQHRNRDTSGHLERLLRAYGDELEAFLAAIAQLPAQRDPYAVRAASTDGEWFYVTSLLRWTDETLGAVFRLIGEADFEAMPNTGCVLLSMGSAGYIDCVSSDIGKPVAGATSGDTGTLVSYDNTTREWFVLPDTNADLFALAENVGVELGGIGHGRTTAAADVPWPSAYLTDPERYPWYPYAPISSTARWWQATIPLVADVTGGEAPTEYEVARVRTRNFDPPHLYDASRSLANEVWVTGGDLVLPFMYPAAWVVSGDAVVDTAAIGLGTAIGLGDGTQVPPVTLPGPRQRLRAGAGTCSGACLIADVPLQGGGTVRLYDLPDVPLADETGQLFREDPMAPGDLDLANPMGTVDYLAGTVTIDFGLNALGYYSLFDGTIRAYWQDRGYYLQFRPPPAIDYLARDYGFATDKNDPEERQRTAIAHLWQYFGCKAAPESYRIRGEVSLFTVAAQALWRLCSADLAAALPTNHVYTYGASYYTDLAPRHLRMDDIRADEQYYDTFDHDPASPAWLTLADRALMFEDDAYADGLSAALAFGLDVTQGYYAPVSEVNATLRGAATALSVTALSTAEAALFGIPAGYRVGVQMLRCQAEAFHFQRGAFGLTVYDRADLVPPAVDDTVYWIDAEEVSWTLTAAGATTDEDVGTWTVIIGTGVGATIFAPGVDLAVRYYPEVDHGDCCFCRSYKMRVLVEPMAQAYAYYQTEAEMLAAVDRLRAKIETQLLPIHARVAEWVVTTEWTVLMGGVQAGWADVRVLDVDEWTDLGPSGRVLLGVEQRGELDIAGRHHDLEISNGGGTLLAIADAWTGAADATTWYPVAGYDPASPADITSAVGGEVGTSLTATATAAVGYGEVRWTFRVTRSTLP